MPSEDQGSVGKDGEKETKSFMEMFSKVFDETPLPSSFNYMYMIESHMWRTAMLTFFTLGLRLGTFSMIAAMMNIVPGLLQFILLYWIVPMAMLVAHQSVDKSVLNENERRVLLMITSFFYGIGCGAFNIEYILHDNAPPSYFLMILVSFVVWQLGPSLGHNRRQLVGSAVGTAAILAISIAIATGKFTLGVIFHILICMISAAIHIQLLIAAVLEGNLDMTKGHIIVLSIHAWERLLCARLFGSYDPKAAEKSKLSIANAILS